MSILVKKSYLNTFVPEIEAWLKEVGSYYGHLTTARFTQIGLAEFETQSAVDYFTKKEKRNLLVIFGRKYCEDRNLSCSLKKAI